jgi:hypothetical protein
MTIPVLVIFLLVIVVVATLTGRNIAKSARGQTPAGRGTVEAFRRIPGLRRTVRQPYRDDPPWDQPPRS